MTGFADGLLLPDGDRPDDGPVVLARAGWPATADDTLRAIPGFVLSTFNPMVAEVADRCLRARYGQPPVPDRAGVTALVLASARGDVTTIETAARDAAAGHRVSPLLFFQSNPNAVLGWIAARWDLTGPVLSIAPTGGDLLAAARAEAELLIADGEATDVLLLAAELDPDRAEAELFGPAREMSLVLPVPPPAPAELIVPEPAPAAAAELIVPEEPR
jgi:hypothetical protein